MSLQLVGVDLETGGLNGYETLPSGERVHGAAYYPILEMAFVVCDENLNKELSFSVGIWDESFLERMSPWALEAHTKSGLISQLRWDQGNHEAILRNNEQAERYILGKLESLGVLQYDRKAKTGAVMFGNSIGFDVSFIDAQMPSLKGFFHYRTIDVSSIDLLRQTAWAGLGLPKAEKQYAHTAMSDIQETLSELVGYTDKLELYSDVVGIDPNRPVSVTAWGDVLNISVGADALIQAVTTGRAYGLAGVKVTDRNEFFDSMINCLRRKGEDGSTKVHAMLDRAVSEMIDDGDRGIELDES